MTVKAPEIYELISRETKYKYLDDTIHLFIGGSAAHGAKIENKSDLDLYGVFVPPIEEVVGITNSDDVYVWNTTGDEARNGPGDIDMNMYSLIKWAGMAASGNPTALEFLFVNNLAPRGEVWDQFILPNTPHFLSSRAGFHFLKFCEHMLKTLNGEGTGKRGQRPDLIAEFGYDSKAAMHLIRVLNEGIELMETGKITLPRPEKDFLIDIRLGRAGKLADINALAKERFVRLDAAQKASSLPPEVSRENITQVITAAQLNVWNHKNEVLQVLGKAVGIASWWISEDCKLHPPNSSSVIGQGSWVGDPKAVEKDLIALAFEFYNEEKKKKNGPNELPVDE
jgi:predicted nucleotidyltransferase